MKHGEIVVGKIEKIFEDKEFGFISVSGLKENVYFNFSQLKVDINEIKKGSIVEFKLETNKKKGFRAAKINKSSKPRTVVKLPEVPVSIPINLLSLPDAVETLNEHISTEGPILFTWFRDFVSSLIDTTKGFESQNKQMLRLVKERFPERHVQILQWPSIYRSEEDTKRSTHPFISRKCRLAIIVSEKGSLIIEELFMKSLVASVYQDVIEKSTDRWTLVGDETGGLEEFSGRKSPKQSEMCWVAIPPKSSPPALSQYFHTTGNADHFSEALTALKEDSEILLYSFPYEEGNISKGLQGVAADPHLDFWQDTLPLVLEDIAGRISEPANIDIFIEQVGPLESGIGVIAPIVRELKSTLNYRQGWNKISFGEDSSVLSKNPCEHPWIGYSDALGHVRLDKKKWKNEAFAGIKKLVNEIRIRVNYTPYRKSSLIGIINPLLRNTSRPQSFLQSLHSIDANDLRDYVRPFFGNAIKESLEALSTDEWQDLLEHIDIHSRDKKGQRATAIIHDFIDIDEVLAKLDSSQNIQFDLLRMMLGTSNHRGAMYEGKKCKEICEEMLNSGFEPTPEKLQKFQNLIPGFHDNMFDFERFLDSIAEYSPDMADTKIRNLGTKAQSLGLTGVIENVELAIQIEEKLASHGDERRHKVRHALLHAELLLQIGKTDEAHEIIEGITYNPEDSFMFATMLKCFTLGELKIPNQESFLEDMVKLLDDDHPSQRIAHWCARWALETEEQDFETRYYSRKCIAHLLSLTEVPLFSHDAPGVILACELKDLESRGYELNFDTEEFFEMVKANSQPSTLEWLEKHPPNEDDWLAPLNFNYR